ncbi:SH3 domain-containing protein [Thalassotalea aquiviva]|uniref:SH3 domain-containing protein n=1 Tax=Thalassotalea aquiviva TaxID=3242415 RepID=UPI00352A20C2
MNVVAFVKFFFGILLFTITACSNLYLVKDDLVLQVVEPYLDLRLAPSSDSDVFYSIEQQQPFQVFDASKGFFKIRTLNGHVGWISATELLKARGLENQTITIDKFGHLQVISD